MVVRAIDRLLLRYLNHLCAHNALRVSTLRLILTLRIYLHRVHTHFFKDFKRSTTAQYIIAHALGSVGRNPAVHDSDMINSSELRAILALADRRIVNHVPFEYLTNEAEYLDRAFYVDERVLIPRSLMNTRFSDFLREAKWSNYRVLDLCTGSGCIGITLALMDSRLNVDLADLSEEALRVAQTNITRFGVGDRVKCIHSDLFDQISDTYDLIVTNPPYVSPRDYQSSPREFKHEPRMALEALENGMALVHRIIADAPRYLTDDGSLIAEIGVPTARLVMKKYKRINFEWFPYRDPKGRVKFYSDPGVFRASKKALLAR